MSQAEVTPTSLPTSPSQLPDQPLAPSPSTGTGWFAGLKAVKWGAILIEDGALSLGRVMGWVVFAGLLYLWMVEGKEPPMSMVETFWALLVYNANKKVVGPLTTFFQGRRGGPPANGGGLSGGGLPAAPFLTMGEAVPAPATPPSPPSAPPAAALRKPSVTAPSAPPGPAVTQIVDPWAQD